MDAEGGGGMEEKLIQTVESICDWILEETAKNESGFVDKLYSPISALDNLINSLSRLQNDRKQGNTKLEDYMKAAETIKQLCSEYETDYQKLKESLKRQRKYLKIQLICSIGLLVNLIIYTVYVTCH
jgi:uncharacterized coiled-coil DUF342 family protein